MPQLLARQGAREQLRPGRWLGAAAYSRDARVGPGHHRLRSSAAAAGDAGLRLLRHLRTWLVGWGDTARSQCTFPSCQTACKVG